MVAHVGGPVAVGEAAVGRELLERVDLVRAAETALESLRGGTLPLVTGDVDLSDEFLPLSKIRVRTRVGVISREPDGLYTVRVEARAMVRSEEMVVTVTTQMWKP